MSQQRLPSTCPHDCPSACALEVEILDDGRIGRIHGAADQEYTAGTLCAKVAAYAERVHHPQRLLHPMRRRGPRGQGRDAFERISWDEALDAVADGLRCSAATHGSESVWPYFYAGTMGLLQRDGIQRLRHVMRYSRQHSTICTGLADAGWHAGVGRKYGTDAREIEHSQLVVIWGANPVHTQVNLMHHVAKAKRNGARLVVVDPYRTATAAKADLHLMLRPGTDGALACAVMSEILTAGLADRDYLREFTDWGPDVEAHLAARNADWAAPITGLDAGRIREFARLYGQTPRSYLRVGYGFTRSRNGAVNMHAVSCLPAVTGAWRHRGGGALYSNSELFGIDKRLIEGLDALDTGTRLLDQSRIGPVLCGDPQDLGAGPPVTALFIQNTNPMAVAPDSGLVRRGFMREDLFVCVHEQFFTETAAMADILLPATTFLEHPDLYTAGGHTYLQLARALIPAPGECRSNHRVICDLARRLGAQHPGFEMEEWEILDATLKASGRPGADELAEQRWLDCALPTAQAHFQDGFPTDDGRFHFRPGWQRFAQAPADMPALPDHYDSIDQADAEHPFRLVTAPARWFLNSSFGETDNSRRREGRPRVKLHPQDAADLAVAAGDPVTLGNRRGEVTLAAEIFEGLQRGVCVVESIWPGTAFADGRGINTLTSADAGPPNGGAVFHDTAIWIRRAGAGKPSVDESGFPPARE